MSEYIQEIHGPDAIPWEEFHYNFEIYCGAMLLNRFQLDRLDPEEIREPGECFARMMTRNPGHDTRLANMIRAGEIAVK